MGLFNPQRREEQAHFAITRKPEIAQHNWKIDIFKTKAPPSFIILHQFAPTSCTQPHFVI
jgi:hypothetical protein